MLELENCARRVIACWSSGNLAHAVRQLQAELDRLDSARANHGHAIEKVRKAFAEDQDFEIDHCPLVCEGTDGIFLNVWHWLPDSAD